MGNDSSWDGQDARGRPRVHSLASGATLGGGKRCDMTTSTNNMLQPPSQVTPTPVQVFDGPITRSRAKKLQQEVHHGG
jgi:hypothetical protein